MRVFIIISLICILLTSCSKSIYYAWDGGASGYSVLEITPSKIIYRNSKDNVFFYIENSSIYTENNDFKNKEYLYIDFSYLSHVITIDEQKYKDGLEDAIKWEFINITNEYDSVIVYQIHGRDSLILNNTKLFEEYRLGTIANKKLQEIGISNFPITMHRVDMLNYKKLSETIPKKLLMNPFK